MKPWMARKGKDMVTGYLNCDWVRERLSLLAEDTDGLAGIGGDLPAEDRAWIEDHLIQCESCRNHRAELEKAMAVLGYAAAEPWNEPASPSIWLDMESRIQNRRQPSQLSYWQIVTENCPQRLRLAIKYLCQCLDRIRGEAPLQFAWTRDSLYEVLQGQPRFRLSWITFEIASPRRISLPRLVIGLSLTAAIVSVLVLSVAYRQEAQAKAQIAASSAPLPVVGGLTQRQPAQTMDVIIATEPVTNTHASSSLAHVDAAATIEPLASGPNSRPAKAVVTAKSEATVAPTSSPHYDFYLEHGTPMPPELRAGKPAY
jgi:anti-sigma factor RsiW